MSQEDLQLPDDVEQLKAMVAGQAVAMAERDASLAERESVLAQHEATISQHETIIDSLHETIEKQLRKLEGLHQQLARLLRKQYGPQKERIDPDQLTLFSSDELESLVAELQQGGTDSVSTDDGSDADVSSNKVAMPPGTAGAYGALEVRRLSSSTNAARRCPRPEDILSRHGIIIRRSTLCDCRRSTVSWS